jgi:hypothetical protein
MFPFVAIEHLFHHSLEGRLSGMCVVEFVEDSERRSQYGHQIRCCFCVAAGQGVRHHVSHAKSKLDAEIEADEHAGRLVLRGCCKVLVEDELQAEVFGLDEEWAPP